MSVPVNVLAVMDEAADWLYRSSEGRGDDERSENVKAVRAGVAELIEAAERVKQQVEPLLTASGYFHVGAMEKLRHALANIGGAS